MEPERLQEVYKTLQSWISFDYFILELYTSSLSQNWALPEHLCSLKKAPKTIVQLLVSGSAEPAPFLL